MRIIWKKQEKRAVMAEALRILTKVSPELNQGELLRQAQLALPSERRTALRSSAFLSNFFKEMRQLERSGHLAAAAVPPRPMPEKAAGTAIESPANAAGLSISNLSRETSGQPPEIVVVERQVIVKEYPDYGRIPTVTLGRILLERLAHLEEAEAKMFHFTHALDKQRAAEAAYDRRLDPRPVAEQPKPESLRICIIGLLPDQQREVETKTANVSRPVKLRFYKSDTPRQELPNIVDYIIVSRFVNHAWWDKAKATLPTDCIFFIDGGIQSIVQKIYDLASRQPLPASIPPQLSVFKP
jgi:hypothetical protein